MKEGTTNGKSKIVAQWVIKDKDGNIKEQGIDGIEPSQKEGRGEEEENDYTCE